MMGPPAVSTAWFFHQRFIADGKGWSLEQLAAGVAAMAAASFLCSILFGSLVDRFGAVRLTRFYLAPLGAASLMLTGAAPNVFVFFMLIGMTSGASGVVVTAALAEIYGVEQLGMIRAVAGSIMVIASAITPALAGVAFDAGFAPGQAGLAAALYLFVASLATFGVAARRTAG